MRIPRLGCVALRGLDRKVAMGQAPAGLVARKLHLWYIERGIVVADESRLFTVFAEESRDETPPD